MQAPATRDQSRLYLAFMLVSAAALVGVVMFGIVLPNLRPSSPASGTGVRDPKGEAAYRAVYQPDAAVVHADSAPFAGSASRPGVCSKGGTRQACAAAGEKVLGDLRKLQADLGKVAAPARFSQGDSLLKQGIQAEIEGLTLRDQAMVSNDPTASAAPGNARLGQADDLLKRADKAFPADARPVPALLF